MKKTGLISHAVSLRRLCSAAAALICCITAVYAWPPSGSVSSYSFMTQQAGPTPEPPLPAIIEINEDLIIIPEIGLQNVFMGGLNDYLTNLKNSLGYSSKSFSPGFLGFNAAIKLIYKNSRDFYGIKAGWLNCASAEVKFVSSKVGYKYSYSAGMIPMQAGGGYEWPFYLARKPALLSFSLFLGYALASMNVKHELPGGSYEWSYSGGTLCWEVLTGIRSLPPEGGGFSGGLTAGFRSAKIPKMLDRSGNELLDGIDVDLSGISVSWDVIYSF